MRTDSTIEIYVSSIIENEIGGYDRTDKLWGEVDALFVPAKKELTVSNGVVNLSFVTKVYTRDELPNHIDYIVHDNVRYKVVSIADYVKVKLLTIERVD